MKAIVIREHGGIDKLVIEDIPKPEPGPGQVRVKVHAVSLNHLDVEIALLAPIAVVSAFLIQGGSPQQGALDPVELF